MSNVPCAIFLDRDPCGNYVGVTYSATCVQGARTRITNWRISKSFSGSVTWSARSRFRRMNYLGHLMSEFPETIPSITPLAPRNDNRSQLCQTLTLHRPNEIPPTLLIWSPRCGLVFHRSTCHVSASVRHTPDHRDDLR